MKYVVLSLSGAYRETAPLTRTLLDAGRGRIFRFDSFLARIEFLLRHAKIDTVLVDHHLDFQVPSAGALESVRHQFERLAAGGRKLVYYARSYDTAALYLASACSVRLVHPLGSVRFQGMARSFLFFKRVLDKNHIRAEVVRRGRYKSAGDRFRVESLDEHNREQHQAILDATMKDFTEQIRKGFVKDSAEIDELLAGRVLGSEEAVESKWMSRSVTKSKLLEEWKEQKAKQVSLSKVKRGFGRGKGVAVLVFEGAIIDGRSRQDPVMGQSIGSDSFLPQIERLVRRKSVKGVVFRVNSPGGSAIASEELAEGLARLAEKKPLVVSMSAVAGSGGYWIALPGERIFAERSTITGSIGVISMLFSARQALSNFGVTESTIKVGELADLGSPFKEITDRERTVLDGEIDRLYQAFLAKVATARKSTPEKIHEVAEGRIWTGEEARTRGLVDETGGVDDALEYLKTKLGVKRLKVRFFPVVKYPLVQRIIMRSAASIRLDSSRLATIGQFFRFAFSAGSEASFLLESAGKPLALMPDVGEYR